MRATRRSRLTGQSQWAITAEMPGLVAIIAFANAGKWFDCFSVLAVGAYSGCMALVKTSVARDVTEISPGRCRAVGRCRNMHGLRVDFRLTGRWTRDFGRRIFAS